MCIAFEDDGGFMRRETATDPLPEVEEIDTEDEVDYGCPEDNYWFGRE